ncbi:uncharacterized protein PITG_00361 [Phytophthora infestans T30-4]|uniref:Uncharacterized protein n=1 Tax=Phytophthora infestans (strain T30-4) TaxID=403677 RepID=D0MQL4_PHYIT|nr:uncharacterized protein PITG_00361 [Phytophthora infestans T30-4]EEY57783.1 conserved hypothetical protein [Phytophthora infestans T30-4]|eukprot:XP_002908969.1 conserved hypothetical protein [Phytophthora infestans T30-4]
MGKEQLLDALAGLQSAGSVEGIRAQFGVVHEALSDIRRKRWRFLEDTCSLVLRHVFGLASSDVDEAVDDEDSRKPSISTLEGLELCLEFIEPLIHATVSIVDALDDEQEAASQRGVLVAALLNLFARVPRASEAESRLVADALLCGVDIHAILATLRFREELIECRRALLPSYESDSEAESELDSDDDEGMLQETGEFESEDVLWITEHVAKTWGLSKYRYFLQTSGQEYAFAAWSYRGIGNFVHAMLTDEQYGAHALTAVVSPFSWLFHIAAYAHYMIHSEDHQLLRVVVGLCPQGKLALNADRRCDTHSNVPESFRGQAASFRERDWMSPLIQVVTNAMVSFPEANDRSSALAVLKELVSKITLADRFYILRDLIVKCPYGNVAAVLVDFVRNDAVHAWSSSTTPQSPFQTTAICILLQDTLTQSAERDLVLHADLIASCLSLLRFLYIRDKDNSTGIRTKSIDGGVWDVLTRINKRLQLKIQESTSGHTSLGSTLELCR